MRFLSKISVLGPDECWPWTAGSALKNGRGTFSWSRQGYVRTAPVFAIEWLGGVALNGLWALHTCHNPACCNPKHLYAGTHEDNTRDMCTAGRQSSRRWSDEQIREMRDKHAAGRSTKGLAKEYGTSLSRMQDIVKHRRYRFA
jgi:hypothetical protein